MAMRLEDETDVSLWKWQHVKGWNRKTTDQYFTLSLSSRAGTGALCGVRCWHRKLQCDDDLEFEHNEWYFHEREGSILADR